MKQRIGKKGWIRIVEATIAIVLLASVLVVYASKHAEKKDMAEIIYKVQHAILEKVVAEGRDAILNNNTEEIKKIFNGSMSAFPSLGWNFTICDIGEICKPHLPEKKDIYTDSTIVSATNKDKILNFYVWIK